MSFAAEVSVLLSLENIQQQIQHCENIVENIDKLVPNLYKIRQQAQAQRDYISDVSHSLVNNNKQLSDGTNSDSFVASTIEGAVAGTTPENEPGNVSGNPVVLMVSAPQTDGHAVENVEYLKNKNGVNITKNKIEDTQTLRNVIQSLYKYKHDQGTPQHFTTEQIDNSQNGDVRLFGLNLNDVDSITEGLNDYLSINNTNTDATTTTRALLKLFAPVRNTDTGTGLNPTTVSILKKDSISLVDSEAGNDVENVDLKGSNAITSPNERELTTKRSAKTKRTLFTGDSSVVPHINDMKRVRGLGLN